MLYKGFKYFAVLASFTLLSAAACSDDDTGDTAGTGGSATTATTTTGGMGGDGTGGAAEVDCNQACSDLYDCGVEDANCPGFSGDTAEKDAFVEGCVPNCEEQPLLAKLVDPNDCSTTVDNVKGASADFKAVCEDGFGGTGGAGGGQ